MRVLSVVGARPNFMKLAPVDRELVKRGVEHAIVHTGQHYDHGMSTAFFEQLWIPAPDFHLGVGSGSHAQQTAAVMQRLESIVVELSPDLVLVYGSTNSTLAAANGPARRRSTMSSRIAFRSCCSCRRATPRITSRPTACRPSACISSATS